jgi:hypothetical protein
MDIAMNITPKANRRRKNYSRRISIATAMASSGCSDAQSFRGIAMGHDRRAQNFLAAVCLAATVSYWYGSGLSGGSARDERDLP